LDLFSIILFPILFFLLLYSFGGRIDISNEYRIVAFSLFVGGASGNLAGYLIGLLYYRVIALPVTSGIVASPPPIGLEPIFVGLNSFFAGLSAIALSNFRAHERKFGIMPAEIATDPRRTIVLRQPSFEPIARVRSANRQTLMEGTKIWNLDFEGSVTVPLY